MENFKPPPCGSGSKRHCQPEAKFIIRNASSLTRLRIKSNFSLSDMNRNSENRKCKNREMRHFAAVQISRQHRLETAKLGSGRNTYANSRFNTLWVRCNVDNENNDIQLRIIKISTFSRLVSNIPIMRIFRTTKCWIKK